MTDNNFLYPRLLRNVVITLLLLTCHQYLSAQKPRTFKQADSTTYALYLSGEWDQLVKASKASIDAGFDYYYMRMRLAYANYMKGNYRMAIPHYKKAWQFNPDTLALRYLINACEYGGRSNDALQWSKHIPANQMKDLSTRYTLEYQTLSVFNSFHKGLSSSSKGKMRNRVNLTTNSIQKITNYFNVLSPSLTHRLGRSLIFSHNISYMNKNEDALWIEEGTLYTLSNQKLTQWNYNLQARISLWGGLSLTPSMNYTYLKIPPANQYVQTYTESYFFNSIKLQQDLGNLNLGVSYSYGEANKSEQMQYGAHLAWYPLGNLNLYYSLDAFFQQQSNQLANEDNLIHKHKLGFKATPLWWIEVSGLLPEISNFYDNTNGILYNGLENIKNDIQLNHYFLTKNRQLTIVLNMGYYQSISYQVNVLNTLDKFNKQSYNNISFTGGLIWKL